MTPRALFREPLVHFLGLGLLLFGLHALVAPGSGSGGSGTVRIEAAAVAGLADQYRQKWGRLPTRPELDALIEAQVRDEILYREGLVMGLDRDDAVIKRRVRQKYELIAEEEDGSAPSEADLAGYLKAHPERFRRPAVVSFDQVLVPSGGDGAAIRAALAAGGDPARLGEATLLPPRVAGAPLDLVARDFGGDLAAALASLPVGSWQGPLASGYGLHVVRITARTPPVDPPLAAVRGEVQREWESDRRRAAAAARYAGLRQRYDVVVAGR